MPGPLSPVVMRFGGALSGLTWRRCFSYDHGNDRKLYWAETAICNQATVIGRFTIYDSGKVTTHDTTNRIHSRPCAATAGFSRHDDSPQLA